MLVLIAGGFDLSVGSNLALTSICSSMAMVAVLDSYPDLPWLAVAAGFVVTLGVGALPAPAMPLVSAYCASTHLSSR